MLMDRAEIICLHFPSVDRGPSELSLQLQSIRVFESRQALNRNRRMEGSSGKTQVSSRDRRLYLTNLTASAETTSPLVPSVRIRTNPFVPASKLYPPR